MLYFCMYKEMYNSRKEFMTTADETDVIAFIKKKRKQKLWIISAVAFVFIVIISFNISSTIKIDKIYKSAEEYIIQEKYKEAADLLKSIEEKKYKDTVGIVNAKAQAEFIKLLEPMLTDEELSVFKRGRNTRVNSVPKHMSIADYHAATGFEALFGWLWLKGDKERLNELFEIITCKIIED